MSAFTAIVAGLKRASSSPFILLGLWLVNAALALPAAWVVSESLREGIDASRVQQSLTEGFDWDWFGEYREQTRGVDETFTPTVRGAGAFYNNIETWLTGELFTAKPMLAMLGVGYAVLWILMLGGVVDRYAFREQRAGVGRFFGAGGRFFFRFVRLAVFSGLLYAGVYWLSRRAFEALEESTRDVTVESTIIFYSLLIWGLVALLLTLIHAVFGYAKIATVVDDRRSAVLAALRGLRFVATHPGRTLGQYYGVLVGSGLLLAIYAVVAPGVGQSSRQAVLFAFAVGQLFLLVRMFTRLALLGGQVALYQAYLPSKQPDDAVAAESPEAQGAGNSA